ncbi:MAG: hydrogen gas-evolving membrane-bound hydrogenase subunit E [Alkalispirochaeta sp.]
MGRVAEVVALLLVALFLVLAVGGSHPEQSEAGRVVVERGVEDTGAVNLVTAIYLGYRAYDTLGETIVLLMAVSGVMLLVKR